jgi:hypothetical protein
MNSYADETTSQINQLRSLKCPKSTEGKHRFHASAPFDSPIGGRFIALRCTCCKEEFNLKINSSLDPNYVIADLMHDKTVIPKDPPKKPDPITLAFGIGVPLLIVICAPAAWPAALAWFVMYGIFFVWQSFNYQNSQAPDTPTHPPERPDR